MSASHPLPPLLSVFLCSLLSFSLGLALCAHQYLFPNPAAPMVAEDYLFHFEFLGRVLGKAVFEDILVEPQFSPVFLNKLLGRVRALSYTYKKLQT